VAVQTISDTSTDQARQVTGTAKKQTGAVVSHATDAAGNVADTAKEQFGAVAEHAGSQSQQLAEQAQEQLAGEATRQTSSLATNVRDLAAELRSMAGGGHAGSALQALFEQLADKGEAIATTLDEQGPDGLIRQAQDVGRRRPGAFLLSAAAAGFATTRLAKHATKAADDASQPSDPYPSSRRGR
jgi:hypothetical protein